MLEGVLASVLNRFLAPYVDGLNTNQLNVGIWSGDVKLRNLRLKRSALDKLRLPIDVKEGYLGQLTLSIPWSNLKGKSVRVLIENVSLLAAPRDASVAVDEDEEEERQQALKQEKLAQSEVISAGLSVKPEEEDTQKTESFISSLVTRVIDNVQITVRNIHIRYEDKISNPLHPFSIGITLAELSAVSTDGNWEPTFVHNSSYGIHKLARLDSLSIYWNTDEEFITSESSEDLQDRLTSLIPAKDKRPDHQYILEPVSGVGKLVIRHTATKEQPKMDAQLVFNQIGITLDNQQYTDGLNMVNLFSFYARQVQYQPFRPTAAELEENRPRALFQFAARAIRNEVHQRRRVWTWEFIRERRDMRREYIRLFKEYLHAGPTINSDGSVTPKSDEIMALERKLEYRDIRFYRTLARREVRKERLDTQVAEAKEEKRAATSGGWLGWLWGSSSSESKPEDDVSLNQQQRKELYDAIEWDEETGKSMLVSLDDIPPEIVRVHVTAKLNGGFLQLRDSQTRRPLMAMVFETLQGELHQRMHSFLTSISLGSLRVEDSTTKDSQFREVVRVRDATDVDESIPLFYLQYEDHPLDGRADSALELRMRSLEIVYHASYITAISQFFETPETELEVIGALMDVASSKLEGLRRETRAGLENALENHKKMDIALDVQSPIWVLPESVMSRDGDVLILDAGHLAVRSLLVEPQTMDELRSKHFRKYTDEDYRQLEELMYDRYFIKLEAVQLVLGDDYNACIHALSVEEERELHLLERINLSFTLHSSILPNAPNLTKCKVTGSLPSLQIHFSDKKYHTLLNLISVAMPGGDEPPTQSPPLRRMDSYDPLHQRRMRIADQLRGVEDTLLDEEDVYDENVSELDSENETFQEPQVVGPEQLSEQQTKFEFQLVVDQVSGTISKSATDDTAEQQLAEAVFRHFRLGVYVHKYKLQVDVSLGSLDLVDCVVEQEPMFRHMITSRALEEWTGRAETPEADAHDLVFVRFINVEPESADFQEVYDGIENSVTVTLSTINLMITRVTVLTVYDWILQTFTTPVEETAPAKTVSATTTATTPSRSAQAVEASSTSKFRMKLKLSSILLRLNDDGVLLSTLTLSTADIAILFRDNSMRMAARVGSLSLIDELHRDRADPSFANLLSIEGDELVDMAMETFDPHDAQYPGYDTYLWLRCNTLKLVYVPEPYADIVAFFAKMASMKSVYLVAADAASNQASQLQARQGLTKYDILIKSPIVVLPQDIHGSDQLRAHLGEMYAHNVIKRKDTTYESTLEAGLRQIRVVSLLTHEGQQHTLRMLDDVHVALTLKEEAPMSLTPTDATHTLQFSASISDITMSLTQRQYAVVMGILKHINKVGPMPDEAACTPPLPASPLAMPPKAEAEAVADADADSDVAVPMAFCEGHLSLHAIHLHLFDEHATSPTTLEDSRLFEFVLQGAKLKVHQDAKTGRDIEVDIKSFAAYDARPKLQSQFRELIPPISHDGHQIIFNYTISPPPANSAVAIVTIDSPKLIFSLDPLFALTRFLSSASATSSTVTSTVAAITEANIDEEGDDIPALCQQPNSTLENGGASDTNAVVDTEAPTEAQTDTTATVPSTNDKALKAEPEAEEPATNKEDEPSTPLAFSFRVNIVEPRFILLSSPEQANSQALVIMIRQVVLSQQTILALSITQLGVFTWRMDAQQDRHRLLSNVDISLSMDARLTATGMLTSIEVDMDRLYLRLTRSDILLISTVLSKALELSQTGDDALSHRASATTTASSTTASKAQSKAVIPCGIPSSNTTTNSSDGQVLFAREILLVRGAGLQVMLISEVHTLPLLDLKVNPFVVSATDWSADLRVHTELGLRLNNFNLATSYWEPFIEPWDLDIRFETTAVPLNSTFTISSNKSLEINVAALMVETTTNMLAYLDQDHHVKEEARHMAPFRICNRTGYRLSVWSESTVGTSGPRNGAHRLDNGHDMPWAFGDWRMMRENASEIMYNRLAVHVDDMPWERVRHISVDREGEYVMALRPKLNHVTHRIMCEVKLVNNVKVITFQSTFRVDNRALIPFEIGLLDDKGELSSTILRIEPGTHSALPICDAYDKKIKVRPDPGLGYTWSNESVGWQDLMLQASRVFTCPALEDGEAPFQFQAYAIRDMQHASSRTYPRLTLALRAPVEIENLLPYDIHYRLFDKNLNLNWSSYLRKGNVSPIHVVALQHLLLLSIELEDSVYSPSEFAIIASDNPDDFQVEHVLPLADESNLKLELRLHYYTYPDSGGAFKVQIYAPYIFLNLCRLPVTIKSRPWAGHSKMVAGQESDESDVDAWEHTKPFLLSRARERNNRFVLRVGNSSWSKPLSFDVIGSEVGVAIPSARGDRELHLGLDIEDGLAKFKLSKVVKLTPRYMVQNMLEDTIYLAETEGGEAITIEPGERTPLHWLHVSSDKRAVLSYENHAGGWTAPFLIDNIGTVFLRATSPRAPQHLLQVDVQLSGSVLFVRILPVTGTWPFLLRNETQHKVLFMQTPTAGEAQRGTHRTELKRYVLEPRSKMKYAWDYPADADKYIRLQINGTERVVNMFEIGSLLPFKFGARGSQPGGVVSLDIRADNEAQVLVISDYSESKSKFKMAQKKLPSSSAMVSDDFEAVDVDTSILFAFKVELAGLGVSLISSKVREIAYITFRGLELSYTESQVTTAVNVICKWIQIDNQTPGSIFPIVLYPTVVPKDGKELDVHPTLQASVIRSKDDTHGVYHIKYASVLLQELTAEVDEDFLYAVYDFVRASSTRAEKEYDDSVFIEHPDDLPEPPPQATSSDQIYIEILHLQPIALNISFMTTNQTDMEDTESSRTLFFYIFNVLTMVLGNVNEAPVRLNALVIENVRMSKEVLMTRMAYHYGQDFLFQVHRILGSADFLGNPVGLFNNVSSGVADIFYEPYYGLVMHGNRELGFGIARGASNFVKKTVFGVTDSVSKLTGSISKGFAAVTLDREFQSRWKRSHFRNKPKHALYGITAGANALLISVASGIEGLALRPLEGAEENGAAGFVQGLGRGLVGAVTKPAAGFFDMASSITEGLRNTTLMFEQNNIDRVRLPRFIASDHTIRPYSEREALGQMWLQTADQGRLLHDEYVAHANTPGPHGGATIMLSESRILYIRTGRLKVLWEVVWSDLNTISLENDGISLVLRGGVLGPFLPITESSTRLWLFRQISGVVQKYNAAHS